MSDNNSASPGFLSPGGPAVPYDDELVDLLQPVFVGISGIPGQMFRPRWQPNDVPNQPEAGETWASLGVARMRRDTFAYQEHRDEGEGFDYFQRSEEHDVLLSVYGPRAMSLCNLVADGALVEQNRAGFNALGMDVVSSSDPVLLPALLHGVWQRRADVTVTLRRCVERRYGVLTVRGLPGAGESGSGLDNGLYVTGLVVQP